MVKTTKSGVSSLLPVLKIDVWWGAWVSKSAREMRQGITDLARENGRQLRFHAVSRKSTGRTRWLRPSRDCAGHIVMLTEACAFQEIPDTATVPSVYVWMTNASTADFQPLIQIDMDDALKRAVSQLASQGYQRIGVFGYDQSEHNHRPLYEATMKALSLEYRAVEFCHANDRDVAVAAAKLLDRPDPPQAIYVNDDVVMRSLLPVLEARNLVPGKNLALITHSNYGRPLPKGYRWTRMEFNPYMIGRLSMECLERAIASGGNELLSFSQQAAFKPGTTHFLDAQG